MSLLSTFTNASVKGWSAIGSDNYPWSLNQLIGGAIVSYKNDISGDGNYFITTPSVLSAPAKIYVKTTSWNLQSTLTPSTGNTQIESIAINTDGSYAVLGCPYVSGGTADSAYVFVRSGSTWTEQQRLQPVSSALYGQDVAINGTGEYIVVGDPLFGSTNRGTVYVYVRSGSTWSLQQTIVSPSPANNNQFGSSVSIDYAGAVMAISEPGANSTTGKVHMYTRSGSTWTFAQTLTAVGGAVGDTFGFQTELDSSGTYLVVNTSGPNLLYVFKYIAGTWVYVYRIDDSGAANGISISTDGNVILVGDSTYNSDKGTLYAYSKYGSEWLMSQQINPTSSYANIKFGTSPTISDNSSTIIVSQTENDPSIFVYTTTLYS